MPISRAESSSSSNASRIIAHIDMDCFYVQVEQRKQPNFRGLPTAVVQYNSWKGGGLIAVSYEARKYGVKRSMRGDDAKKLCPQIQLVQVPVAHGKADLSTYRHAGSEVVSILAMKGRCERASIDEVYLDLTDAAEMMLAEAPPNSLETIDEESLNSHILGLNNKGGTDSKEKAKAWLCNSDADRQDKLLVCGALIVAKLRLQVLKETGFTCSAGIAHNKMLAKLASAMNKPAQQTVVPFSSVERLLYSLPIRKMKHLGGKLGSSLQSELGVETVGDLLQFPVEKLQDRYGLNNGTWLWNIARGISGEEVEARLLPKSHGSGKTFPGPQALKAITSVQQWLNELCEELSERLRADMDQNKRIAQTLTLHARAYKSNDSDSHKKFSSKSCPLRYGTSKIQEDAFNLFQTGLREYLGSYRITQGSHWGITALSVSASKIVAIPAGTCSIVNYFGQYEPILSTAKSQDKCKEEAALLSPLDVCSESENYCRLNLPDPENEHAGEEYGTNFSSPSLHRREQKRIMSRNEIPGTCSIMRFFQPENPSCSSSKQASDCAGMNQAKVQTEISHGHTLERCEQKKVALTDKESSSILRFFKSNASSCSSMKRDHLETHRDTIELLSSGQAAQRMEAWSYNINEIDPSVVAELPSEMQEEFRAWLRPQKRHNNNTVKRGSGIAQYFFPTKSL